MRFCVVSSKHITLLLMMLCLCLVAFAGCSKNTEQFDKMEREQSEMRKASSIANSGDSVTAINLYYKALEKNPGWAKAHLELALLFHDMDPVSAVYHYKKYLHLRPETEKMEMIEGRIRSAEMLIVSSVLAESGQADASQLASNSQVLRDVVEKTRVLNGRIAELEKENAEMKTEVSRLKAELDVERLAKADTASKPMIYRVKSGDTLSDIAARVYNDSEKWKIIYDANRQELAGLKSLKVGQALVIPEKKDNVD